MGQGIEARCRRQLWWKIASQFRVEDDQLGDQPREEDSGPALRASEGDDRTPPHLAPRPSGGRNANAPGQAAPIVFEIKPAQFQVGTLDQQPAGLADIQRAAPAERDDRVAIAFAERLRSVDHILLGRIAVNLVEQLPTLPQLGGAENFF